MSNSLNLSAKDVDRLLNDPSEDNRADMAVKIAETMTSDTLSQAERELAHDILNHMARDAAVLVRQSMANSLKGNAELPRDIAKKLLEDEDAVALPVLEYSKVLTDADLIEVIKAGHPNRQSAVARREVVSADVSDNLVEHGDEKAVATLMANDGADVTETAMDKALVKFPDSKLVHAPMVKRAELPLSITERLIAMVEDHLKDHLVIHHNVAPEQASDLILQTRERTIMTLAKSVEEEQDLDELLTQLNAHGRITPSLVIRSLCLGDIRFFEEALAKVAGVSVKNARILVHDAGPLGLKSLWERCGFPINMVPVIKSALTVIAETAPDSATEEVNNLQRRVIERILTQADTMDDADIDFLMKKLNDLAPQRKEMAEAG